MRPSGENSYITTRAINPSRVLRAAEDDSAGAVVLFIGTVRSPNEGHAIEKLEYQAYREMAEKRMQKIESEARSRWPLKKVVMVHREGELRVGDVSVAVAVSAEHRAEAYEACRYAIEEIKHKLPIWKRERISGGKRVWVEGVPISE